MFVKWVVSNIQVAERPREAWAQLGITSSFTILNAYQRRLFVLSLNIQFMLAHEICNDLYGVYAE